MTGFEPVTSSLPRKHSTPELHRQNFTFHLEKLRHLLFKLFLFVGRAGFEPAKVSQRIYSPSSLAACVSSLTLISLYFQSLWRDSNPRPADYKSAALAS